MWEVIDIFTVLLGVTLLLLVVAITNFIIYRLGHASGVVDGTVRERERRDGLESRIRQGIERAAKEDAALWSTEIDA